MWQRGVSGEGDLRLNLSTARSRKKQSFILYFFCNLLLLSFAAS